MELLCRRFCLSLFWFSSVFPTAWYLLMGAIIARSIHYWLNVFPLYMWFISYLCLQIIGKSKDTFVLTNNWLDVSKQNQNKLKNWSLCKFKCALNVKASVGSACPAGSVQSVYGMKAPVEGKTPWTQRALENRTQIWWDCEKYGYLCAPTEMQKRTQAKIICQ